MTMKNSAFSRYIKRLRRDESGLAMVEFAVSLPFFLGLTIGGVEIANYASVVMQLNQITLHTADNAARIGETTPLQQKRISELQINDVFEGTLREGDRVALSGSHDYIDPVTGVPSIRGNARIILSSVEEVEDFDPDAPRYRIRWQRCAGTASQFTSHYGTVDDSDSITGIGPAGRQVTPPPDGALMFVELQYHFKPLFVNGFSHLTERDISQVASMPVRENRDLTQIYNNEGVTPSLCGS